MPGPVVVGIVGLGCEGWLGRGGLDDDIRISFAAIMAPTFVAIR